MAGSRRRSRPDLKSTGRALPGLAGAGGEFGLRRLALAGDVPRDGKMGTVAIDSVPVEVEIVPRVAGEILRLVRPQVGDHIGRMNGSDSHVACSVV